MNSNRARLPTALVMLACAGCGGSDAKQDTAKNEVEIAYVEGTITMDGKPLAYAGLNFIPEQGGRPAGAMTNADGFYVLNFSGGRQGTVPGKNRVRITTERLSGTHADGSNYGPSGETVPDKYNVVSKLVADVKAGEKNVVNFDLDSDGPVGAYQDDDESADSALESAVGGPDEATESNETTEKETTEKETTEKETTENEQNSTTDSAVEDP